MTKATDIEIYKRISETMNVAEVYLGHIPFAFHFSKVQYTATCTEAIPFNSFDKVICELLKVENQLSFEEIGDILGMNVYASENPKRYLDLAEKEILTEALQSLTSEDYKMMEGGDIDFSRCRLLPIGKEYAAKNCKFKTTINKPFTLYFDHTTGNHINAKASFEFVDGTTSSKDFAIEFADETTFKAIALTQIPDIYNPDKQYSFTNEELVNQKDFVIEYPVVITYNPVDGRFYFYCYNPLEQKILSDFTSWLNQNKESKKKLLDDYFSKSPVVSAESNNAFGQAFKQSIALPLGCTIGDLRSELINKEFIDEYLFYSDFGAVVPSNEIIELYVCLPFITESVQKSLLAITQKAEKEGSRFYFVFPVEVDPKTQVSIDQFKALSEKINNFYVIQNDVPSFSLYCKKQIDSFYIQLVDDFWEVSDGVIKKTFAYRKNWDTQADQNIAELISIVAEEYSNELCKQAVLFIEKFIDSAVTKKEIEELSFFESKLEPFIGIDISSDTIGLALDLIEQARAKWNKLLAATLNESISKIEKELSLEPDEKALKEIQNRFKIVEAEINQHDSELLNRCKKINDSISVMQSVFEESRKVFSLILDTGVYLKDPGIVSKIQKKNKIVLPEKVLDELNGFRNIQQLREMASLCISELHANKNKNINRAKANLKRLPKEFSQKTPDNLLLAVAFMYKTHNGMLVSDVEGIAEKALKLGIPFMTSEAFITKFVNSEN